LNKVFQQFSNIYEYRNLIWCLVKNDLKVKYRRSFLGFLWSLLNPLMMMSVMAIAFTQIIKVRSEEYVLYLLCSLLPWGYLSECLQGCASSVIRSENLIKSQNIPLIVYPIKQSLFSMMTFSFQLIALLCLYSIIRMDFPSKIYYLIFTIPLLTIFCTGLGILLSVITVYFRDIQHLLNVVLKAWFYLTPILYPLDILPEEYQFYLLLNPATHFIQLFSEPLYKDMSPGLATFFITSVLTIFSCIVGMLLMIKFERKLIFRL